MRLKVEVELDGMSNVRVNDGAGDTVPRAVGLVRVRWEEADVVTLTDDDDRNLRVDVQGLTGRWRRRVRFSQDSPQKVTTTDP
jgi:hypothetical protein